MSTFPDRLGHHLQRIDDDRAISGLKAVIADELAALDKRSKVLTTRYFNHSFSPDIVIQWPSNSAATERHVYLRFGGNEGFLAEDVELISDRRPIVFELPEPADDFEAVSPSHGYLNSIARERDTLVTDAEGIQELLDARQKSAVVTLANSAIAQGGSGLLAEREAEYFTTAVTRGFSALRDLEPSGVTDTAAALAQVLNTTQLERMTNFLRAVWVGEGGRSADFPLQAHFGGELADEALEFLLEFEEIGDPRFWRRVGRRITLEQIMRLQSEGSRENFQLLVSQNVDRLTAKLCHVIHLGQQDLLRGDVGYSWTRIDHLLTLRGPTFDARLATHKDQLGRIELLDEGVEPAALLERAENHDIDVTQLEFMLGDRRLAYGSDSAADVIHDSQVSDVSSALGTAARISRCFASVTGDRELEVDFLSSVASGRTASKFPVPDLLTTSLALLANVPKSSLSDVLPRHSPDPQFEGQMSFYDIE